ncbi:hypothetical protein BN14_02012 [Rhizoctonia solani AG-1 IB]|uniref:Uncharacterized protein n=1 Tax=Thanatephorus cucumeris (strain AG1-IB / isolate 7/3/14) TaxID=1108050 RepID=M5BMB2_THACB|nr:hypothetical protein BN14_02012 [Rhizoctonia solani AG-1 IB]
MALDQARQRQLELERNPPQPKPSPTPAAATPIIATVSPPAEPAATASPLPSTTVTPSTASRLQALAMQQKAQVQARPTSTQPQVAIRQSRPTVNMPNGKPLSNGTPPAATVQRPGSAQGMTISTNGTPAINVPGTVGAMVIPGAGGVGTLNGSTAGGLTVPQQRGSASPHDNRGGSPLRPLSGMASGTAPNPTAQAAYQQLTQQQQIELKPPTVESNA